jgi:hypothetical protein
LTLINRYTYLAIQQLVTAQAHGEAGPQFFVRQLPDLLEVLIRIDAFMEASNLLDEDVDLFFSLELEWSGFMLYIYILLHRLCGLLLNLNFEIFYLHLQGLVLGLQGLPSVVALTHH